MPSAALTISLFLQGLLLGAGPCLLVCGPVLIPYLASTQKTWKEGFAAALIFLAAKFLVYVLLGTIFGYLGALLLNISRPICMALTLFIFFLGIFIILDKNRRPFFLRRPFFESKPVYPGNNHGVFPLSAHDRRFYPDRPVGG